MGNNYVNEWVYMSSNCGVTECFQENAMALALSAVVPLSF